MLLVELLGRLVVAAAGLVVDEEGRAVAVVGEAVDLAFQEEAAQGHGKGHLGAAVLIGGETDGLVASEPAGQRPVQPFLLTGRKALFLNLGLDGRLARAEERPALAQLDGLLGQAVECRAQGRRTLGAGKRAPVS